MIIAYKARQRLAWVWGGALTVCILALLVNTLLGGLCSNNQISCDKTEALWGWFLSATLPTLSLIVSAVIADSSTSNRDELMVERFYFHFALGASLIYFLIVVISMIIFIARGLNADTFIFIERNILSTFGQILTSIAIGIFFTQNKTSEETNEPEAHL